MKKKNAIWILIGLLTFSGWGSLKPAIAASEADEKAVSQAAAQFYTALNAMFQGDLTLMKDVWSHADDVTYMGPDGGLRTGWNQEVLPVWEKQTALKLGGRVEPADMKITVGQDLAVTSNYENGENVTAGGVQKVSIRATNVFRKEDGQWKMIGHHTDRLSFLS